MNIHSPLPPPPPRQINALVSPPTAISTKTERKTAIWKRQYFNRPTNDDSLFILRTRNLVICLNLFKRTMHFKPNFYFSNDFWQCSQKKMLHSIQKNGRDFAVAITSFIPAKLCGKKHVPLANLKKEQHYFLSTTRKRRIM